jgi:hypothetical protein
MVIKGYFDDSRSDGKAWTVVGYVAWFKNDRFVDSSRSPSRQVCCSSLGTGCRSQANLR